LATSPLNIFNVKMESKAEQVLAIVAQERPGREPMYILAEVSPHVRKKFLDGDPKLDLELIGRKGSLNLAEAAIDRGLISRDKAKNILYDATTYGHLTMAKWLEENFNFTKEETIEEEETEDEYGEVSLRSNSLLGYAVLSGRLEVIQWVAERFGYDHSDVVQTDVYPLALDSSNVELLLWLEKTFKIERGDVLTHYVVENYLVQNNIDSDTALWFLDHFQPTNEEIIGEAILDSAINAHRSDIIEWILDNAGPNREQIVASFRYACIDISDLPLAKDIARRFQLSYRETFSRQYQNDDVYNLAMLKANDEILAWLDTLYDGPILPE